MQRSNKLILDCSIGAYNSLPNKLARRFNIFIINGPINHLPESRGGHQLYSVIMLKENEDFTKQNFILTIGRVRRTTHLLVVEPKSPFVASKAISDRRVDGIILSLGKNLRIFRKELFTNMLINKKMLFTDLSCLLSRLKSSEVRPIIKAIGNIKNQGINIILCGAGGDWKKFRQYRNLVSLGKTIGIDENKTKLQPLLDRIERNSRKLSYNLFSDGITIIENNVDGK